MAMRMRTSLIGYSRKSVRDTMAALEQSHVRRKATLVDRTESLREEKRRLEAEIAALRATLAAAGHEPNTEERGDRDG